MGQNAISFPFFASFAKELKSFSAHLIKNERHSSSSDNINEEMRKYKAEIVWSLHFRGIYYVRSK